MNDLKALAEKYAKSEITDQEMSTALPQAERKLKLIISREGDENGIRRKPFYIAQLIAEIVALDRMSSFLINVSFLTQSEREHPAQGRNAPTDHY